VVEQIHLDLEVVEQIHLDLEVVAQIHLELEEQIHLELEEQIHLEVAEQSHLVAVGAEAHPSVVVEVEILFLDGVLQEVEGQSHHPQVQGEA
jgi:hypothetical protein